MCDVFYRERGEIKKVRGVAYQIHHIKNLRATIDETAALIDS